MREVRGLFALMLITGARRATRVDEAGLLVLLEDQDRSRWVHAAIEHGRVMVLEALRGGRPGWFVIQASLAALHAEAGRTLSTYHYLPATRADFLRRLGRDQAAAASFRTALALVENDVERAFLECRLAEVLKP